ncbi:sperm associated antigen 8 [Polyodon spathula]|uniref:sperm associated antigen 8 n=1 Tax=Polyodon spathula TaxID=7913 RepID=UPI001B7E69EE|nr:sperm associated antigen 8 [Polyodon spathula]
MAEVSMERNRRRSPAKCLLYNWVEERATGPLDNDGSQIDRSEAILHKQGHRGILSVDLLCEVTDRTTTRESYTVPKGLGVRQRGMKEELLEKYLYQKISEEVLNEFNSPPPLEQLISVTKRDYNIEGFKSVPPPPTKEHDYKTEQPVTYWSENSHKIQGVTAVRTRDTPFKKNSSFSKPISECLDDPMPYTEENYPNL